MSTTKSEIYSATIRDTEHYLSKLGASYYNSNSLHLTMAKQNSAK